MINEYKHNLSESQLKIENFENKEKIKNESDIANELVSNETDDIQIKLANLETELKKE